MISGFTPYVEDAPYSQLLAVFEITEPGELALKSVLYDIPRPVQSIAFDKAGKHAYMLGGKAGGLPVKKIQPNEAGYLYPNFAPDSPIPEDEMDLLMVANIKQPGVVTLDPSHFARLKRQSPSLNNGIESLVVRNDTAWVGYATPWYVEEQAEIRSIASVDLKDIRGEARSRGRLYGWFGQSAA